MGRSGRLAREATNPVEVLPPAEGNRKSALVATQVTTRSPMGAIIYETGGILVDHGWIRILGSGCDRLPRSLPEWNKGRTFDEYGDSAPYLLVADDVIGGFFAVDGGGLLCGKVGSIFYYSPDTVCWEPMDMSYSDFVRWCFTGDVAKYYADYRWSGWQEDVRSLPGDKVFSFYPFLWAKAEGMESRSRRAVPVAEHVRSPVGHCQAAWRAGRTSRELRHQMTLEQDWPFADPKNVAVITLKSITKGGRPILHVTHDADDGMWQFLDGSTVSEENASVVSLEEITRIDPSVMELADLPLGWYAVSFGTE